MLLLTSLLALLDLDEGSLLLVLLPLRQRGGNVTADVTACLAGSE